MRSIGLFTLMIQIDSFVYDVFDNPHFCTAQPIQFFRQQKFRAYHLMPCKTDLSNAL